MSKYEFPLTSGYAARGDQRIQCRGLKYVGGKNYSHMRDSVLCYLGCGAGCTFRRSSAGGQCWQNGGCRAHSGTGRDDTTSKRDASADRYCESADGRYAAAHRSGVEFDDTCDTRQQHATVYGKPEYFIHPWDYSQRFTVRNYAGYGRDTERFDTEHGIVQLGGIALNLWKQPEQFSDGRNVA